LDEIPALPILLSKASELRIFSEFVVDVNLGVVSGEVLKNRFSLCVRSKCMLEYIHGRLERQILTVLEVVDLLKSWIISGAISIILAESVDKKTYLDQPNISSDMAFSLTGCAFFSANGLID
jgi:hypothetical protein